MHKGATNINMFSPTRELCIFCKSLMIPLTNNVCILAVTFTVEKIQTMEKVVSKVQNLMLHTV